MNLRLMYNQGFRKRAKKKLAVAKIELRRIDRGDYFVGTGIGLDRADEALNLLNTETSHRDVLSRKIDYLKKELFFCHYFSGVFSFLGKRNYS